MVSLCALVFPASAQSTTTVECWTTALPAGGVAVAWEVTPFASVAIARSDSGTPVGTVYSSVGDEVDWHDASGTASSSYEVSADGVTEPCASLPFEPGLTAADVGLTVDESGEVTLSAGSTAPTRINDVPTGGPSSSTPTGAASQCSARLTLPIPTAGTVYTALTIPTGMTMKLDVMNYKEEATATGNWSYHLGLHRRTSAGELGTYVKGGSGSTSYYWDGNPWQNHPDFLSFTNTSATDTEFLLALSTNVVVGVPASEGVGSS